MITSDEEHGESEECDLVMFRAQFVDGRPIVWDDDLVITRNFTNSIDFIPGSDLL